RGIIDGLKDGTIDAIATDHAPHAPYEKEREFDQAPFGILGLETSFPVAYTTLVKSGILSLAELVNKMSAVPARILGIPGGTLEDGAPADVAVFGLDEEWSVDAMQLRFVSHSRPFAGWNLYGCCVFAVVAGRVV